MNPIEQAIINLMILVMIATIIGGLGFLCYALCSLATGKKN
jgi:hypothetical protein